MAQKPFMPEFREFLSLLNAYKVRYLVVGGYAVGFHGHPRYTKDIDLWIDAKRDNADKLSECLHAFFGTALDTEKLISPRLLLRIGVEPNMIELMTRIDGVEFGPCYERRRKIHLGDLEIPVLALSDLRTNKAASGRHQDLADLENLPPLDESS